MLPASPPADVDDLDGLRDAFEGDRARTASPVGRSGVHTHMANTMSTSTEALPLAYPFTVERYMLWAGTERRASSGRRWRGVAGPLPPVPTVSLVMEYPTFAPWGLAGGEPGSVGRNTLIRADGSESDLGARAEVDVGVGIGCGLRRLVGVVGGECRGRGVGIGDVGGNDPMAPTSRAAIRRAVRSGHERICVSALGSRVLLAVFRK